MSSTRNKKAGRSGWIVLQVFLTGGAYYVTTEIAWALCFPNSKVSLLFRRTLFWSLFYCWCRCGTGGRILWPRVISSFRGHAAGTLAGALRFALRGFRRRAKRVGRGRDSPLHQVAFERDYAARRHRFRFDCRDHRSLRHGVLGRGLYHLQPFRN